MTIETVPDHSQEYTKPAWKGLVREKRAAQRALIPSDWHLPAAILANPPASSVEIIRSSGILSTDELSWTETTDICELIELIKSRRVTSESLTTAFCKRAAIAQQVTKCLTEIFFDKALARARELDEHLLRTGEVVGPLHGIPVSVKDRFDVEGFDTTLGWAGLANKPAKSNSSIVQLLESMGAVLYVKTNIPQSLMMADSYNHVFGQSTNAFNHALISGGSSGGEGALVGCGGSVLGIGTDIGGSIRVPSNLQGLYSVFPSTGRVPWDCSFLHQHYLVPPVAGPMATSMATTEYFMESLLASHPWNLDPYTVPIPWRKELAAPPANRKLRLGVVFDDGVVKPQPPVARAMRETVDALRAAGHEVIEWDTSLHIAASNLWTKGIQADGGQHCRALCEITGEPLIQGMLVGKEGDLLSSEEREQFEATKMALQTAFLKQWVSLGIDALLMPVIPWVGYKPKTWVESKHWVGYTAMWNLLDYAAVTVPVTRADRGLDSVGEGVNAEWETHSTRNESDAFNYQQYDIDLVHGMPIGVQIIGGRFGEEKAVAVGKVIDELVNQTPFHP
ncbi:Amidasefungi [Penicillium sp. IBT 31633x]|nr:Amidasefungi [Penicillium sp. IBT 31633x]